MPDKENKKKVAKQSASGKKDANASLTAAKKNKDDEFYTQLGDIEKELAHYKEHFKGKIVFCNCDDPEWSSFWKYFSLNFKHLGLKKVISTHYEKGALSYKLEFSGDGKTVKTPLNGDGDFRSDECVAILKEADVVVTNPPFSLFREYVAKLIEHDKQFLIIGNQNAITYAETFNLIKGGKIWLGYAAGDMAFKVPSHSEPRDTRYWVDEDGQKWRSLGNAAWFTNLDISKRHEDMVLYKTFIADAYPKYDDYDVINIDTVKEIPMDYAGVMGVPITFLSKHNPDQFEILGIANSARWIGYECFTLIGKKKIYNRLMIRKKEST